MKLGVLARVDFDLTAFAKPLASTNGLNINASSKSGLINGLAVFSSGFQSCWSEYEAMGAHLAQNFLRTRAVRWIGVILRQPIRDLVIISLFRRIDMAFDGETFGLIN